MLDIRGSGANSVIVDAALVTRLSDTNVLRIRADSHDLVTIAANDAWIAGSDILMAGINYAQYTLDSARLQIEATAMREVGRGLLLGDLNGTNGLRLAGVAAYDFSGDAISAAGDVKGDGFDDLLIGDILANPHGDYSGSTDVVFGRDFTGTVAQQGGSGNDTLVWDGAARLLDGGSGVDTLRITGRGVSLDFNVLAKHHITAIEHIDISGTGNNSLTLDIHDVLALPDHTDAFFGASTHQVLVDGDSGDTVHSIAQGWVPGADVSVQGTSTPHRIMLRRV